MASIDYIKKVAKIILHSFDGDKLGFVRVTIIDKAIKLKLISILLSHIFVQSVFYVLGGRGTAVLCNVIICL